MDVEALIPGDGAGFSPRDGISPGDGAGLSPGTERGSSPGQADPWDGAGLGHSYCLDLGTP